MTKKGNNIIGILFVILVVFVLIGFFIISSFKSDKSASYFKKDDRSLAVNLYEKVMSISEENYPTTPENVVSLYTDGYKLLYGDKIKDLSIVPNILEKQRILFSDELVTSNDFDKQLNLVLESIENLKENKVKITSIDIKSTVYDQSNKEKSYVRVTKNDSNFQSYYYIYYLQKENDKWKITGWYNTDENYNIIG